jgi:hypothetical protein
MLVSPNEDLTLAKRTNLSAYLERARPSTRTSSLLGVAALALAGSAVVVNRRAAQAERDYLAKGRFVTARHALPFPGSGAVFAGAWRQGPASLSGSGQGL